MTLECISRIQKTCWGQIIENDKDGNFKELYNYDDEDSNSKESKKKKSLRLTDKDINKVRTIMA